MRKKLALSQEKFGALAEVSKSAVSQWESEQTTPERDALFALQKNAGINPEWITSGLEPMFSDGRMGAAEPLMVYGTPRKTLEPIANWETHNDLPAEHYALVPRNQVTISATNGQVLITMENAPPLIFPTLWITHYALQRRNLAVFEAADDRMQPRICPGDTVLIDRGQINGQDRKPYLLRYNRELRVQRLSYRYDGALMLQSLNPSYSDEIIPAEALNGQVEIVGRVVWSAGDIN